MRRSRTLTHRPQPPPEERLTRAQADELREMLLAARKQVLQMERVDGCLPQPAYRLYHKLLDEVVRHHDPESPFIDAPPLFPAVRGVYLEPDEVVKRIARYCAGLCPECVAASCICPL